MFNFAKAIGKFFLGAAGVLVGFVVNNPQTLLDNVPQKIASLSIGGLIIELLDFIHHIISKSDGTKK